MHQGLLMLMQEVMQTVKPQVLLATNLIDFLQKGPWVPFFIPLINIL
jgi:hypothetical protein